MTDYSQWSLRHVRKIQRKRAYPMLKLVAWFDGNTIFVSWTLMPPYFVQMIERKAWKILFQQARGPTYVTAMA